MGNPTFITVTDPNYRVGISGGTGDLPLGHGGFIVTDGSGTGTYYEFGLYQQGTFTNVNGANSFSPNGAIRSLTLTGLEYDSSGNVTQQSMQSALDQVFGSSGMYTSDTGMAIASTFSISQQQYDTITQSFIPSQIAGLTSGSERYSISNNDCQQFVLNAATSAGLTVEANQNGSGPALPSLDFVNIEQNASANYQYFGPNSWKGSAIQPDSGFSATLNSLEDAAVQVSEAIGRSTLDIGSRVLKAVSDAIITPANGAEATQTQNGLTVTDGSESYEFIQQTGVNVSASSDGVGTIVDLEGGNTLTAQNSQTVIDAAAATAGGVTVGQADTVNATGATVDVMSQAQATVTGSSNTIVADVNTSVDAVGSNDVIDLSANGGSTLNVSGTGDTVNSIGNSIEFDGSNANLTVNGSDNTFTFSGTNDTLAVEESTLGAGVSQEIDNYSITNSTATLTNSDFNFTDGTSQQELFNPNATTSMEVLNYTGLNETGTLTDETFDFTAGGSQIEFFNPQTGVSLETDNYTGADGGGTLTSSDFNFTGGTSQQELFNPNATTSMEVLNYTGLNETGTLTDETFDLTAGGSQIEFFNPQTGVSLETDSYTGADGTGTLTSADFNLTDGTSQQQLFNPQSGVDTEIIDYTGLNESGTVTDKTFDWTAGGSQEQFFNPATGVSEAIENFTGADGGGELSTAVVDRTDGESLDYTFQYNSSGVETDYTVDLFNSSGQQVWAGEYSPTGGYISGSGGYTGPGGTYGGGYGGGYFGGGYDFASGTTAGRGSAGKDISLIAASDASAGKLSASTDHASGHGDDAARRSSDVMALMRGDSGKHGRGGIDIGVIASFDVASGNPAAAHAAEAARLQAEQSAQASSSMQSQMSANFEGAKWSGKTITWSLAEGPGTDALPFSGYLSSAYKPLIEKAFQQWAAASGLTFQEVQDSTSADIRIGWGKFDTATSGVIGYTGYQTSAGQFQPNTIIRLEDPQQDPLVTGKDGQLTYSGTTSELYQVVLHEIGHALGLADNSDPNSIMYYASGPANRTLDHTDVAGIQSLYGAASGAGITTTPTGVSGGANAPASGGGLAALLGSAGGLLSTLAIDQQEPGQGTPNARLTQMIQAMSTVHENGAGWAQEQHTPLAPTPEPAVTVSHPH